MSIVFNELLFCKFDDDCQYITVDDDLTLKGFTSKPKYFKAVGKWLLDSSGETFVYHAKINFAINDNDARIIERSIHSDDWCLNKLAYPISGVNNGENKPYRISTVKELLESKKSSIVYDFKNYHLIELGNGDFIRISLVMSLEITDKDYDLIKPSNENDRVIRVNFSNDKHREYIRNTYDYMFDCKTGNTNSIIVVDSEYNKMYNTICKMFNHNELKTIVDDVRKKYV